MVTLVEGKVMFDENEYDANTTLEYGIKAYTYSEGCACNDAVYKKFSITQKASG